MKLVKLIRAAEWWEYKFPPILVVPYFIILKQHPALSQTGLQLLFVLASLAVGAIYVSVLNDITDLTEDRLAGKKNRIAVFSRYQQAVFLLFPVLVAVFFCWLMRKDVLAITLYCSCYLAFTLYSLPPFRLKKRGIIGLFADASGSQMLPTLFTAAYISTCFGYRLAHVEILMIAVWSLCFGLRGILWHQFHDLENDRKSGLYTVVQHMGPGEIKLTGRSIIAIEIIALIGMIITFGSYYFCVTLILYFTFLLYSRKKTNVQLIMLKYTNPNFDILMNVFYQVFLPIAILIVLAFNHPAFIALLVIHLLLFPNGYCKVLKTVFS